MDFLKGGERDQPFVLRFAEGDAPAGQFQIPRIERLRQQFRHALIADFAVRQVLGIVRLAFEKALNFDLRAEPPRGEAFERFGDDRSQWFIPNQDFALAGPVQVRITTGSPEHPIAVHSAGAHPVFGLLRVLLALMLADTGEQVFNENGVAVLAELDGRAFEACADRGDGVPQFQMGFDIPCKTADIVDDDDKALLASLKAQIREHGLHTGACRYAPRNGFIGEDAINLIAFHAGEFPAAGFLRSQPLAFANLSGGRYARIDDGVGRVQLLTDVRVHGFTLPHFTISRRA